MKIFVIGDSISIQYGPYLQAALHGIADYSRKQGEEEALRDLDLPQGANGGDSSMVLAYLKALAGGRGLDSQVLLVNCGLHDIKSDPQTGQLQISADDYYHNLQGIVAVARTMEQSLIWLRSTPLDERIHNQAGRSFYRFVADLDHYNQLADNVMAEHGVPVIDLHGFTVNLGPDLFCDHVHFHDHIRSQQAAFIAGWLSAYCATQNPLNK